jgi:hypothetical protein
VLSSPEGPEPHVRKWISGPKKPRVVRPNTRIANRRFGKIAGPPPRFERAEFMKERLTCNIVLQA